MEGSSLTNRAGHEIELKAPYQSSDAADSKGFDGLETGSDQDEWDQDVRDMRRLGKQQEFKRNFSFISEHAPK